MRKTLITYVKPHVQEDPLAMVLGIGYIGAALERAQVPVELCDERIVNDQYMREAIERNDLIGFDALTPNIRRAIAWAKYAKSKGKITIMGGPHASVDQGIFLDSGHFDYVLKGEAEETLPQFLKALEGNDDAALGQVAGLAQEARRAAAARAPLAADAELLRAQPRAPGLHLHDARMPVQMHLLPEGADRPRLPRALDADDRRRARADRQDVQPGRRAVRRRDPDAAPQAHPRDVRRDPAPRPEVRVDRQHARRLRRLSALEAHAPRRLPPHLLRLGIGLAEDARRAQEGPDARGDRRGRAHDAPRRDLGQGLSDRRLARRDQG